MYDRISGCECCFGPHRKHSTCTCFAGKCKLKLSFWACAVILLLDNALRVSCGQRDFRVWRIFERCIEGSRNSYLRAILRNSLEGTRVIE